MDKKPWESKTLWTALILAVASFFPVVQEFIKANPEMFAAIVAGIFTLLRLITGGKISIGDSVQSKK